MKECFVIFCSKQDFGLVVFCYA